MSLESCTIYSVMPFTNEPNVPYSFHIFNLEHLITAYLIWIMVLYHAPLDNNA